MASLIRLDPGWSIFVHTIHYTVVTKLRAPDLKLPLTDRPTMSNHQRIDHHALELNNMALFHVITLILEGWILLRRT